MKNQPKQRVLKVKKERKNKNIYFFKTNTNQDIFEVRVMKGNIPVFLGKLNKMDLKFQTHLKYED